MILKTSLLLQSVPDMTRTSLIIMKIGTVIATGTVIGTVIGTEIGIGTVVLRWNKMKKNSNLLQVRHKKKQIKIIFSFSQSLLLWIFDQKICDNLKILGTNE